MRKKLLLVCFIFLLVGCTRVDNVTTYVDLVRHCLVKNASTNEVSLGYQYYIPKGVRKIHDYDYNQIFLINGDYVYLYVDIVSYYYKKSLRYEKSQNAVYFETFDFEGNNGYIEVIENNGGYYVKMLYHYSKIEFYTTKGNLNKLITLSSIILNSVRYNDNVIEKVLNGNFGEFSELTYEVAKPVDASDNFSQYLEEYVQKEEEKDDNVKEKLPDE